MPWSIRRRRAARDPLVSSSALTMLSMRSQNDDGITGSAMKPASITPTTIAGFSFAM